MTARQFTNLRICALLTCALLVAVGGAFAKKVMYYSEKEGILWVEESKLDAVKKRDKAKTPEKQKQTAIPKAPKSLVIPRAMQGKKARDHTTYYQIGQRYFYDGDHAEALRYFENAYKIRQNPEYYLFIAKCHRKLGNNTRMLFVLTAIQQLYPESKIADDALFELALYHETMHDYQSAIEKFKQLTEQYPYGASITNKQEFRQVARVQIEMMNEEIDRLLGMARIPKGLRAERIKRFQKLFRLPVSGKPDLGTMGRLRMIQERIEQKHRERMQQRAMVHRARKWLVLGLVLLFVNWFWAMGIRRGLKSRRHSIETLERSLESL